MPPRRNESRKERVKYRADTHSDPLADFQARPAGRVWAEKHPHFSGFPDPRGGLPGCQPLAGVAPRPSARSPARKKRGGEGRGHFWKPLALTRVRC